MSDCITFTKAASAVRKWQADVSGRLTTPTGSSLVATVGTPVSDPPGQLVIAGAQATSAATLDAQGRTLAAGKAIEFTASAGTAGTRYEVRIPYVTNQGEEDEARFFVEVE
jgi:hypothetical protein